MTEITLADGSPVPADDSHLELKPNGQQRGYVVLSEKERADGFVRPVRLSYWHVGAPPPRGTMRPLTEEENKRWGHLKYVQCEETKGYSRFWTQDQLDRIGKGCGTETRMSQSIAETYARDPKFYGGTFCVHCGVHYPVAEFVWSLEEKNRLGT